MKGNRHEVDGQAWSAVANRPPSLARRVLFRSALGLACIGGLYALATDGSSLVSASPVGPYRLATVDVGTVTQAISTAGAVKPLAAILVGSQASGQIKELLADFNSRVRRGEVIARLNADSVEARLAASQVEVEVAEASVSVRRAERERALAEASGAAASVAVARAELERADVSLRDAERELERKRELMARGAGALADRERAEAAHLTARAQLASMLAKEAAALAAEAGAKAALRTAEAQLQHALAQVKQRQAAVAQVQTDLDHTVIKAPIDGVVVERTVEVGQTVAASLQAPTLFTIAPDLRRVEVHAQVDEADVGRAIAGQEVTFTVDSFRSRPFYGRVVDVRKMPQNVQNVVTYTVVISADNDELLLLPGMTANARIVVRSVAEAVRVPNAALRFRPAGSGPAAAPVTRSPDLLLREAAVRARLGEEVERMVDGTLVESGCARAHGACREAARRISASLSDEQRRRFDEARAVLARKEGPMPGEVWAVGPTGAPIARSVLVGTSDGIISEVVSGLAAGEKVIVSAEAPQQNASSVGF